ncbi:hypothetical protein [Saccharopolyspora cebuensis]|uniref:hypothetical protein n=1 Tax=Saccharopolyspora cebuensis TaxID=418759 RepID=UPI0031EF7F07
MTAPGQPQTQTATFADSAAIDAWIKQLSREHVVTGTTESETSGGKIKVTVTYHRR